jgi:hypothetical protein
MHAVLHLSIRPSSRCVQEQLLVMPHPLRVDLLMFATIPKFVPKSKDSDNVMEDVCIACVVWLSECTDWDDLVYCGLTGHELASPKQPNPEPSGLALLFLTKLPSGLRTIRSTLVSSTGTDDNGRVPTMTCTYLHQPTNHNSARQNISTIRLSDSLQSLHLRPRAAPLHRSLLPLNAAYELWKQLSL